MASLNALDPVVDINAVVNWVNQQAAGGAEIAPEVFHSKQLLDTIRYGAETYTYYKYADAQPIQEKADKLVLRRWSPLRAHTVPLSEGVPPKSDKGSNERYELEAQSYGRYMEFSDKVTWKAVDPIIAHYSKEYSIVAVETLDMLARDALLAVSQKYYAGSALSPDEFTFTNGAPNMTDLRHIIMAFKRALVKPRNGTKYPVIGSAEFYWDMLQDTTVQAYMTINMNTFKMYDGGEAPLVPMFDMVFEESPHVPASGEYYDENGDKRLKIWTGVWGGVELTDVVGDSLGASGVTDLIETDPTQYSIVDGYELDSRTGQQASYIPGQEVWELNGAFEFKMHHIFVLGKDALARTGLTGEDSAKMYVKPLGSSGVLDPIDQRQSIGFKINSVGFGSIRPEAVYDYICVPSQANV